MGAILQELRLLVVYPVLVVSGMVWLAGFAIRYRHTRCTGDRWAMVAGVGMLAMGVTGLSSLWMASVTGFNTTTASLFTIGLLIMTTCGAAGALRLFVGAWRLAGRNQR